MKRISKIVLAFFLVCAMLSGCKGKKPAAITADNLMVGFVYIGSITDHGYTEAQDQSRIALVNMGIQTMYKENVPENSDCEKAIRDLISAGCNVIYTTSYGFMDSTINVAKEFPNVKFAHCSGFKTAPNVSTYFGRMYEARYLAGVVAGLKTKTNKIGYVAAFPISECIRGINGFALGVQSVNPEATVDVLWTKTWYEPETETKVANELLSRGCDVIEQHQDSTASQIAAEKHGAFAIGYNVATPDAAPKAYLTAPVFRWSVFVKDDVYKILAGTWESRKYWEGLRAGMVDIAPLSNLVAPGTNEEVAVARTAIENGSLKIFEGPIFDQDGNEKVSEGVVMTDDEIWNMDWFVKGVNGEIR